MTLGTSRRFHHKYKFVVRIDGFDWAGFKDCSDLSSNAEMIAHAEGGSARDYKEAGRVSYDPITLSRGVAEDVDCYDWFKQVYVGASDTGENTPQYKKNLSIVQFDRDGSEIRIWDVYAAFPTKFVAGSWDNSANEFVMESVTLEYDYFDK